MLEVLFCHVDGYVKYKFAGWLAIDELSLGPVAGCELVFLGG